MKNHQPLLSKSNTIAVYTVLRVLIRMRKQLGIEASLEYMGRYCALLEARNPQMDSAVSQALKLMDVNRLYEDITH